MDSRPSSNTQWVYDSPVHSEVEAKLRRFLVELGNADRILGMQVCAYKDGQVIIDTAVGVMGIDDPRPVQPDTLFPVFSATKGVTSGMVHWLADKGKLKLDENVANIWPEFGTNGKDQIKVHHILNHSSGLHNALARESGDETLICDWDECVKRIAMVAPVTEPGLEQLYNSISYGWLCGGIIEHASGKTFQDILEEAFVRPLNVEGEFYIGIPNGVESRLATITFDTNELNTYVAKTSNSEFRSRYAMTFSPSADMLINFIHFYNTINVRRAILPSVNGQFSARALARYYAALVNGGAVPPQHSSTLPPLGSHPHNPTFPLNKTSQNQKDSSSSSASHTENTKLNHYHGNSETDDKIDEKKTDIFSSPKSTIHGAILGKGEYKDLTFPKGIFGLGFWRISKTDGSVIGFGHPGLGGATAYCDINNQFSIAVTLNKLCFGTLIAEIIRFVCSELDLPVPKDYAEM